MGPNKSRVQKPGAVKNMSMNRKNNISILIMVGAAAGIAAFILEPVGMIVLGFLKPGYNAVVSTISELGESGGANYLIAGIGFILTGVCEIIFAVALYHRFKGSVSALLGALLIAGHGIFDSIGSGLFPIDQGGRFESASGQIHLIVSAIGLFMQVLAPFFILKTLSYLRYVNLRKYTQVTAIIMTAGTLFFGISFFTESLIGLSQRIIYYIYYIWILVLSVFMLNSRLPDELKISSQDK